MPIDIPLFRISLTGLEHTLLIAIEDRAGEMKVAVEKGIELGMSTLPVTVAERCRAATVEAVEKATEADLKEYFSPGGDGYEQVMEQVKASSCWLSGGRIEGLNIVAGTRG